MYRRIILLFSFLPCWIFYVSGQSPYFLNWQREISYLTPGGALMGGGWLLYQDVEPLPDLEVNKLKRVQIAQFDRPATFNQSAQAAEWSDQLALVSYALPALFAVDKRSRSDLDKIAVLYGEVLMLNKGLTLFTKTTVLRPRPFVYNEAFELGNKTKPSARMSFFSGHTSSTAANFFFAAKVFSDYFPESKLKPYVWTVAALVPAATGYLRVAAGKHYPSDVIVGYGVGAAIGFLVPHLHKRAPRKQRISFYPGMGGSTLILRLN